jgi:hypothetical protein
LKGVEELEIAVLSYFLQKVKKIYVENVDIETPAINKLKGNI